MAKLVYDISGTSTGLATAVNDSIALLQKLQLEVNKLGTGAGLTGLGRAIQDANGQATQLNKTLSDTSLSAKDKGGLAALDALDKKLAVVRGNTELFGDSLKNQQSELNAYQSTLNRLLSLGFEPLDGDVQRIKANIDNLTASIANANAAQIRRPEISNSLAEATVFNQSAIVPGNVATSGSAALIAEFKKDLDAGRISVAEFEAEVNRINQAQSNFARQTAAASTQIEEEIGLLEGLKAELRALQAQKLQLVNPTDIAKQNALIEELEAEITRLNNVGRTGFDAAGNAVQGFRRNTEQATGGVQNFGRGLTSAYGFLRQIAYILPGIGIAGLFNLAFEAIEKAAEALDVFNSKQSVSQKNLANLNEVTANAAKQYGEQTTNLKILYQATQDVSNSEHDRLLAAIELQKEFPSLFGNLTTEAILNGNAADAYKQATVAILENAKAKAAVAKISELAAKQLDTEFQKQKILNAQSNELANLDKITRQREVDAVNFERKNRGLAPLTTPAEINTLVESATAGNKSIIEKRAADAIKIQNQNKKILQDQIDFLTQFAGGNNKIAQALTANDKLPKSKLSDAFAELSKQLDEIIAKTSNLTQASGLTGYAEQVQKITANYATLNREIDAFIAKTQSDVKKGRITQSQGSQLIGRATEAQQLFAPDEQKQLADAQIAEAQRVANEIQRINNEFGIKADDSLQKQIDGVNKLADQEIAKAKESALTREQIELNYLDAIDRARGNFRGLQAANINYSAQIQQADNAAKTIIQIQQDRATALDKINQDFIQKETDLWNQIQVIDEQAQAEIGDKTSTETGRIQREWESRRLAADKYYQTLLKIAASAGNQDVLGQLPSGGATAFGNSQIINKAQQNIQNAQANTNTGIDRAELLQTAQAVFGTLTNGITSATRDVFSFFSTFNSETDRSFAALFSGLTSRIEGVFNRIFEDILSKQLNTALINGIADSAQKAGNTLSKSLDSGVKSGTKNLSTQLSSGLTTALAAAGLLGSTISGLTPKTSIVGQGLGGALSGAASGALIGSVIPGLGTVAGGVIGGVVGLVGGIFGASKAQKELQQQQLEQAKEQTAALKASLAYTSQIIGRMTSQGIVTGVSVGATGQLTATVSGKDLQFVLDRNQNGR